MRAGTLAFVPYPISLKRAWQRLLAVLRGVAAPTYQRPDAATLRDLGLHASEWDSIQAEAAGRTAPTRRRVASHQ